MSLASVRDQSACVAYRKVRRRNDYYEANFYHVGLGFRKLYFDKFDLECAFYQNKKGIQSLNFDARHAYTKGINIMPNLVLEKQDFLVKGLDMKYTIVTPIIRSNMTDTATTRRQVGRNSHTSRRRDG